MVFAFLLGVFDKQHLVDQAHKAVGDAAVLLVFGLCGEVVGNLALRVEFGKQAVASVADGRHEGTADFGCVWTEEVFEESVHYVWRCLQVDINPEVVVVAQFVHGVGERGIEHAEKAMHGIHRNLPYAEESQNVVDSVCVEELGHFPETCFPPCEAVAVHHFPVIGGKPPVLTKNREIIRWRAGLAVQIEQRGIHPCVGAGAGNADGYVAFESHAAGVGIVMHGTHLAVEVELDVHCHVGGFLVLAQDFF